MGLTDWRHKVYLHSHNEIAIVGFQLVRERADGANQIWKQFLPPGNHCDVCRNECWSEGKRLTEFDPIRAVNSWRGCSTIAFHGFRLQLSA